MAFLSVTAMGWPCLKGQIGCRLLCRLALAGVSRRLKASDLAVVLPVHATLYQHCGSVSAARHHDVSSLTMGAGSARVSGAQLCAKISVTIIRPPQRGQQQDPPIVAPDGGRPLGSGRGSRHCAPAIELA